MKYTIDDIPYLVGLHFRLSRDVKRDWVYHIHSYRFEDVYVDWPHRNARHTPLAKYPVDVFLENLNDGTWIITDLPSVDISSVLKEESDSQSMPKVDDILVAKRDIFYDESHERFATKDKHYRVIELESWYSDNDRCVILDDDNDRHTLSLDYIHENFYLLDDSVNMEDVFNQLYESNDVVKERGIILKFDPRPTPEQEHMIYNRLMGMFPTIRWGSSGAKLTSRNYSRLGMNTIFIEANKGVSWGDNDGDIKHQMEETPNYWELYDGWDFITGKSTSEIFDTLYEQEDDDFNWAKDIVSSMPDLPKPNHYVSIIFLKRNQSEDSIHNLLTHLDLLGWRWWTNDYLAIERVLSNMTKNNMYDEPHIVLQRNGQLSYGTNLESFEETFGIYPENCKTYSYPTSVIKEGTYGEVQLEAGDEVFFKNNEERPYGGSVFTVGKSYPIDYIDYDDDHLEILDNNGSRNLFTIYPSHGGFSFKSWFDIVPPDIQNTDFFGQLYESEDDFGWAKDSIESVNYPEPDGKLHVIFLSKDLDEGGIDILLEHLYDLGWEWGGVSVSDVRKKRYTYSKDIAEYTHTKPEPYIALKRNGNLAFGGSIRTFENANKTPVSEVPQYRY